MVLFSQREREIKQAATAVIPVHTGSSPVSTTLALDGLPSQDSPQCLPKISKTVKTVSPSYLWPITGLKLGVNENRTIRPLLA